MGPSLGTIAAMAGLLGGTSLGIFSAGAFPLRQHTLDEEKEDKENNEKRAPREATSSPTVFRFNTTKLRGQDLNRLHGLSMNVTAADKAVFSTDQYSVEGNVTTHPGKSKNGLVRGELSFQTTGLDKLAEGSYVVVHESGPDEKKAEVKVDFQKVLDFLENTNVDIEMDVSEAIASIAQLL